VLVDVQACADVVVVVLLCTSCCAGFVSFWGCFWRATSMWGWDSEQGGPVLSSAIPPGHSAILEVGETGVSSSEGPAFMTAPEAALIFCSKLPPFSITKCCERGLNEQGARWAGLPWGA
jgi:hypothetical protein